uniref:Uncharacterized protein n=1 Tax=Anopheles arabiensis TaxID=7173 RepID=A0A182IGT8_ANOAR
MSLRPVSAYGLAEVSAHSISGVSGWSTLRAAESEVLVPAFRRKPFPAEG